MDAGTPELDDWRRAAARWAHKGDAVRAMTRPVTAALLERLAPASGQRVLDVASGVGDPALAIAERVAPAGRVVATDGVEAMLATLRERALERGLHGIVETRVVAAEALDFGDGAFDAASSRFGVMFFADPTEALRRMARCVARGGRLVVAAWGQPEHNRYFTLAAEVLDELGAPTTPPGKTVFEHAGDGALAALARAAGWREVRDERLAFDLVLADTTPPGLLERQRALSEKLDERCAALDEAALARAAQEIGERAAPFARGRDLALPAQAVLVSGRA